MNYGITAKRIFDVIKNNQKKFTTPARLWRFSKESDESDHLIDLRVILESLYAQGSKSEIAYRVAQRGAWHLGDTFEERKKYRELLHEIYDEASKIVHGRSSKKTYDEHVDLLIKGREACRKGILKILDHEETD